MLLAALLPAIGFEPKAVMIGAGWRLDDEVPSPVSLKYLVTQSR